MTTVTFHPARLRGSAPVPPAKSEAHRALLLAALGQNRCRLRGFSTALCDDTLAMIEGVHALGGEVRPEGGDLLVTPAPMAGADAPTAVCHVSACATALRMLIPVFLMRGQRVRFTMDEGLFHRPLDAFEPLIKRLGASMVRIPATEGGPWAVELWGRMPAGEYRIDGSSSSQFASGMLIALAHARNASGQPAQSFLTVEGEMVSRPYLDMTLTLMERFGTGCKETSEGAFTLPARQTLSPDEMWISGDWSQAAVLLCANAMGSGVMVQNLLNGGECLQGDARILSILGCMGMRMVRTHNELYAVCPSHAGLTPLNVDCADIPDIAPILALVCTQARGVSRLRGVRRLTIKECDRLQATAELLGQMGARAEISGDRDTLTVYGPCALKGGFEADARNDHRMVMLLAVAALISAGPITVHGAEALGKSWPGFLDTYQELGGRIS